MRHKSTYLSCYFFHVSNIKCTISIFVEGTYDTKMIQSCWEGYFVFFPVTELQSWELACVGVSHFNNNTKVLTWHSEQSSNWQRFSFLMILSFQIFILWVFCRLRRITHIHSSCICCAMGAFSLFFFCSSITAANKEETHDCKMETANNSAFGWDPLMFLMLLK